MKRKVINIFIILVMLLFGSLTNCYAEVKTYDRNTLDNYGVNKKWTITDSNKYNVLNTYAVDVSDKVYDFSDILTDDEENALRDRIDNFIEKYNMDLVILIDNVSYSYDSRNEEFATDFYDYNDFGISYEKYDGVLFFRNTYESNPYYDAYSFGNAQLYFYDDRLSSILDNVYNNIHSGNYYEGFSQFIDELEYYYSEGKLDNYIVDDDGYLKEVKYYSPNVSLFFVFSLIMAGVVIFILIKKNKMVKQATDAKDYLNKSSLSITNKVDRFITSHTRSYTESDSDFGGGSSGGGGHSSSSGSSGGGHSSGGGRHG